MRHRKKGKKFSREKAPREMMLKNLAASVIMYEKVKTTAAKAKAVRSVVEKSITLAKNGQLADKRALYSQLPQKLAVRKLIEVLADRYRDKKGGYTRLVKIGSRTGDGAELIQIELS